LDVLPIDNQVNLIYTYKYKLEIEDIEMHQFMSRPEVKKMISVKGEPARNIMAETTPNVGEEFDSWWSRAGTSYKEWYGNLQPHTNATLPVARGNFTDDQGVKWFEDMVAGSLRLSKVVDDYDQYKR
jgi:hypothetical protein